MLCKSTIPVLGALAATALGHGIIPGFVTDGKWNQGFLLDYYYLKVNGGTLPNIAGWYAEDLDSGFVEPNKFGTADIICHINAVPGTTSATVSAGGSVTFQWTTWPHGLGPMLTYIAPYTGEPKDIVKANLKWIKIDQYGYDGTWGAQKMINNNNTWTTTIPSTIAPGKYVFRHETIALHGATSANGAQAYPFCFNIQITGSGTDVPAGTLGTSLYSASDPGIIFNPYVPTIVYPIPGPTLYKGGSGSGGTTTTRTTTAVTTAVTTTLVTTTTRASTTTTTAASSTPTGSVALYGQCGGIGYTGPTTCATGTCKVSNAYYSQCLL